MLKATGEGSWREPEVPCNGLNHPKEITEKEHMSLNGLDYIWRGLFPSSSVRLMSFMYENKDLESEGRKKGGLCL